MNDSVSRWQSVGHWLRREFVISPREWLFTLGSVMRLFLVVSGIGFWVVMALLGSEWYRMGGLANLIYGSAECAALHAALNEDAACHVERIEMPVPPVKPWEKP